MTECYIKTGDGVKLAAEVWRTVARQRRGTIIFVHGFAGNKHENGMFRAIAERSVSEGFDAVLYDWRGIPPSQGQFHSTSLEDHVSDFEQVVHWTRENCSANAGILCGIGFSLGAAVIGLALKKRDKILDRIAYLSPAVRPNISMWPRYNSENIWLEIRKKGFVQKPGSSVSIGEKIINSLRWTDLGPSAFDIDVPLLVCHGTKDERINCKYTRDLASKVKEKESKECFDYVEFSGAGHSFRPADVHWQKLATEITYWFMQERLL